jgi:6-phosphogluconolactonase
VTAPLLYVGTYTRRGGEGIYPVLQDDGWRLGAPFQGAQDCSFIAFDRERRLAYCVEESCNGRLRVCRLTSAGWELLEEHSTQGSAPCYVSLSPARTRLAVANYGTGSAVLFALDRGSGLPTGEIQLLQSSGGGPVTDRQDGPHVHCTVFDGEDRLLVVDLGTDRILSYDLASVSKPFAPIVAFAAPPGSGPRHLVLHPRLPLGYLVSELAGTVTPLDRQNERFVARAPIVTAPGDFKGQNLGGHLSLNADATRLYATNRGHDSIAVFAVGEEGELTLLQHVPSYGVSPRSFVLLEKERLFGVVNEEGGNVVIMALEPNGLMGNVTAFLEAPGPAFIFVT